MATARQATAEATCALRILGMGTLASNGLPFLLIESASEPGRAHCVSYVYEGAYLGSRIHCDCLGFTYRGACKHAQRAVEWFMSQGGTTPRKKPPARPVAPDVAGRNRQRDQRDQRDQRADQHGDTAVLARSQQPFSLLAK